VFNLIPIPPLDGSHVLFTMISIKPEIEAKLYRWGTLALFAVVMVDSRTKLDLLPVGKLVGAIAKAVFGLLGM
jgi:membrane-associated protease RseP (regulator of RpoE activity)